jgi:hypothetical protein
MLFAKIDYLFIDVNGSAKGCPIACAKPERDESIFDIFLNDGLKLLQIDFIIELLFVVDVGGCSSIKDIFNRECPLRANMTSLPKIPNKFEYIGIVASNIQFFHFFAFGSMNTHKDRLCCRVIYDSASTIFKEEFLWKASQFH